MLKEIPIYYRHERIEKDVAVMVSNDFLQQMAIMIAQKFVSIS